MELSILLGVEYIMAIEIKVPALPESVSDASLSKWYKKQGDFVKRGESLVDLETDKVMLEVPALEDGFLESILKAEGSIVSEGEILGILMRGTLPSVAESPAQSIQAQSVQPKENPTPVNSSLRSPITTLGSRPKPNTAVDLSPAVRRLVSEHSIDAGQIKGSGKEGRIVKEDVVNFMQSSLEDTRERRVPMSRLRARIAERLLAAQHEAAMLTTFNEVNMQAVIDLRNRHRDAFEKAHGTRLGFMSFFIKASVMALSRFPDVNAFIDGNDIVYHDFYDIGLAVSSPRGLVVPILRDADTLSMAAMERGIAAFGLKAKEGKLSLEEMTGGTFTITNGGVFGSMLSTPIINPPQSAILGMHNIVKRPIALGDEIVIRPIMYLALSYDHRIIDGSQAVRFLVTIKELLEEPAGLLLDI